MTLPLHALNHLSDHQFTQYFQNVFEHSAWVIHTILKERPFLSEENLEKSLLKAIQNASEEKKNALICAHPELGHDKIPLTPESEMEQQQANLHNLVEEQKNRLIHLNTAYREKFGFPFVICVKNHPHYQAIITALQNRLSSTQTRETETALGEIHAIATYRMHDLIAALPQNKTTLSTHVLDLVTGVPATGIKFDLFCQTDPLFSGETDIHGRYQIQAPNLILTPGTYRLAFHVTDYFKRKHYVISDPPFLDVVNIDFGIAKKSTQKNDRYHYHIPLLVSPYGFSTYRGS